MHNLKVYMNMRYLFASYHTLHLTIRPKYLKRMFHVASTIKNLIWIGMWIYIFSVTFCFETETFVLVVSIQICIIIMSFEYLWGPWLCQCQQYYKVKSPNLFRESALENKLALQLNILISQRLILLYLLPFCSC